MGRNTLNKLSLEDAFSIIENCYGFTDDSSSVGEAWNRVKIEIRHLKTYIQYLTEERNELGKLLHEERYGNGNS